MTDFVGLFRLGIDERDEVDFLGGHGEYVV